MLIHRPRSQMVAPLVFLGCTLFAVAAAASDDSSPNATMRYVAVSAQSDADHNQQSMATLSFTMGDNWWAHIGGGKTRTTQSAQTVQKSSPMLGSLGFGVAGGNLQFTLDADLRRDGDVYRQRDWSGALDWHSAKLSLALDGMHRNTDIEAVVPVTGPNGGTAYVPLAESVAGNGFGLRGSFNVTERLNAFVGGMKYNYSITTRQNGDVNINGLSGGALNAFINRILANHVRLAQQLLARASAVNRDEAILDHSYNAGLTYQFNSLGLTGQYINDKALDSGDVATTVELSAVVFIGKHWTLTPGIGRTGSEQFGSVNFASLSVNYGW